MSYDRLAVSAYGPRKNATGTRLRHAVRCHPAAFDLRRDHRSLLLVPSSLSSCLSDKQYHRALCG
jgi:hypothetical protein